MEITPVLSGVWRWADPAGSDRCGTALATASGLVLIDPPALDGAARRSLEDAAGPVVHVLLTSARLAPLGAPFRITGAAVWAPRAPAPAAEVEDGVDNVFDPGDALPGGVAVCQLPQDAAPGEVALFWDAAGEGLLLTGEGFPVVGQVPVYLEGVAPPVPLYAGLVRSLLAMEPGTLAPGVQAPPAAAVNQATGYAAHIGSPFHGRRAAPVDGPRFLVPRAERVLQETLVAPVVLRRPVGAAGAPATAAAPGAAPWLADPFACTRCGQPTTPAVRTCGGPLIARLCPDCRARERQAPPALRLLACAGGCCTRDGARVVLSALRQAVTAAGLEAVEVVPVSCLGECGLGPLVAVQTARGREPAGARGFRLERDARVRQFAADEDETIDDESERILARFTALVQPQEAVELVGRLRGDDGAEPGGTPE